MAHFEMYCENDLRRVRLVRNARAKKMYRLTEFVGSIYWQPIKNAIFEMCIFQIPSQIWSSVDYNPQIQSSYWDRWVREFPGWYYILNNLRLSWWQTTSGEFHRPIRNFENITREVNIRLQLLAVVGCCLALSRVVISFYFRTFGYPEVLTNGLASRCKSTQVH